MTKFTLDVPTLTRNFVGIDRLFDELHTRVANTSYPPHNIYKLDKEGYKYQVELAVAGFSREDLELEFTDHMLSIRGSKVADENRGELVYQGLAKRSFHKTIALRDDIVVKGAKLEHGVLLVDLERVVPDQLKPKLIEIK